MFSSSSRFHALKYVNAITLSPWGSPVSQGIKSLKIVFVGVFSEMTLNDFLIFHIIVVDNGAHHLRQIAVFRKFFKGDSLRY